MSDRTIFDMEEVEMLPLVNVMIGKECLERALQELEQLPIKQYPYLYTLHAVLNEALQEHKQYNEHREE